MALVLLAKRTFVIGLLNTLLVGGLGVLAASIIGFIVGIARLSPNWLIARLANAYIETFRNIPLLLQIFFWYFAVLRALPSARESVAFGDLSQRARACPSRCSSQASD